jgi:hypothetical protein
METDLELSRRDVETAVAASVPVIVWPLSNCYFDGHGLLWTQDDLTYFRASTIDWL